MSRSCGGCLCCEEVLLQEFNCYGQDLLSRGACINGRACALMGESVVYQVIALGRVWVSLFGAVARHSSRMTPRLRIVMTSITCCIHTDSSMLQMHNVYTQILSVRILHKPLELFSFRIMQHPRSHKKSNRIMWFALLLGPLEGRSRTLGRLLEAS